MQASTGVFRGEVTERVTEKPREISQIKRNGLASPAPSWRGKHLGVQNNTQGIPQFIPQPMGLGQPPVALNAPLTPRFPATSESSVKEVGGIATHGRYTASDAENSPSENRDLPEIDGDAAMRQIMQMSPQELQEAQREVAAMFKPKNLEFLKKMAIKKHGHKAPKDSSIEGENVKTETLNTVKIGGSVTNRSVSFQNIDDISTHDEQLLTSDDSAGDHKSERNLIIKERDSFSRTNVILKENLKKTSSKKPSLSSRKLVRSARDRFDLQGRKVLHRESSISDISSALLENSLFKSWNLLQSDVQSIAAYCVCTMLEVGFAVEHVPQDGTNISFNKDLNCSV